jgi:hypothetical protein
VEARATRKNDASIAGRFLFENILMRFGAPWELVSDRGLHFINDIIKIITQQYQISHRLTTPYNPKANGLTERANGIIGSILRKIVSAHKTDWDNKLASAVYAYNTTEKSTTGKSPYYLVYGQNPLSIVGMELPTVIRLQDGPDQVGEYVNRLQKIEVLHEERESALARTREVQEQRKRRFDKKIKSEDLHIGDLALVYDSRHHKFPGKLHVHWLGPYVVTKIWDNGSLSLTTMDGEEFPTRINGSRVKKFHQLEELLGEPEVE